MSLANSENVLEHYLNKRKEINHQYYKQKKGTIEKIFKCDNKTRA